MTRPTFCAGRTMRGASTTSAVDRTSPREVPPRNARPVAEDTVLDHLVIGPKRMPLPPLVGGRQGLGLLPLLIGELPKP